MADCLCTICRYTDFSSLLTGEWMGTREERENARGFILYQGHRATTQPYALCAFIRSNLEGLQKVNYCHASYALPSCYSAWDQVELIVRHRDLAIPESWDGSSCITKEGHIPDKKSTIKTFAFRLLKNRLMERRPREGRADLNDATPSVDFARNLSR